MKEFNFFDNLPFLIPLSKDNENDSLTWKNIEIGQKIKATVISVHPTYIKLGVNDFITGLLYKEHLTDVS